MGDELATHGERPARSRRVYLLEIALFLGLTLVVDRLWGGGHRFIDVEPHPFWAIVLLMAVQYGTMEALVATSAATLVLLVGNMPVQGLDETIHEYALHVGLRPLMWMLASLILGELRARHRVQHDETVKRLHDVERELAWMSTARAEIATAKERLETKLAGQLRTAAGVLEAARQLETLDPHRVLGGASDLLRAALDAKAFSLFLLKGDALTLAATDGWPDDSARISTYPASTALFEAVVGAQRFVSIASPEGEHLLGGQGVMAGPLIDPASGTLYGMLKVDEMRFLDFTLSSVQTFKSVCGWVAAAYANALAHQDSQVEDRVTRLMGIRHLDRQTAHLASVAQRFGFELTLLSFRVEMDDLPESDRRQIPAWLADATRDVLRETDLVFTHQPAGAEFAVLLPGATPERATAIADKLARALHDTCGFVVPCTMQVRSIYQPADTHPADVGPRVGEELVGRV